jgi:hypothetical protein
MAFFGGIALILTLILGPLHAAICAMIEDVPGEMKYIWIETKHVISGYYR